MQKETSPRGSSASMGELPPALDTAIAEINRKTDLNIELESLVRSKTSARNGGDFRD